MGIDAEMLIRGVLSEQVTEEWLVNMSWMLCRSIGAKHFFISDGLPPNAHAVASAEWHRKFNEHPLSNINDDLVRKEIGPFPQERRLAVEPTLFRYRESNDPPPGSRYDQDGDAIYAEPGECLLEVNLYGRYYGVGYERGDILTYCAIAEWLEINIPGCSIWYGGDSSGVCAERFDDMRRRELRRHLYSLNGRNYFDRSWMRDTAPLPPACSLCPGHKYCGVQYGTGAHYASFSCAGCGKSVCTRDHGDTWQTEKE